MSSHHHAFQDDRYKVPDLLAATEFYSKCFEAPPFFEEAHWVVFQIGNYQLWLEPRNLKGESVFEVTNPSYQPSKNTGLTSWEVANVQATCDRFRKRGGAILKKPVTDGPFTTAVVRDPWDNQLVLHSKFR